MESKIPYLAKGTFVPPSVYKKMEDDEKYNELKNTLERQAYATEDIASAAKIQADIAVAKSKKADIKGIIAIIISLFALVWSIVSHFI